MLSTSTPAYADFYDISKGRPYSKPTIEIYSTPIEWTTLQTNILSLRDRARPGMRLVRDSMTAIHMYWGL